MKNNGGINSSGYVSGQLASAFVTATTHEDAATRARADERVRRWMRVLRGMASGSLEVGSRTPVKGLPAWVTPEVVRGGFATGAAAAGGVLRPHEVAIAPVRRTVFLHHLSDAGQERLCAMLDSGGYRVELPEQAALLAIAWLVRAGDRDGALAVLDEIGPFADRLSFAPVPAPADDRDPSLMWRAGAGTVRAALAAKRENARVETMREALTVWNPLADEFLALWLAGNAEDGAGLLAKYEQLAATHTRCTKHRHPRSTLAVLRAATTEVVHGRDLTPRLRGMLRTTVDAMVAKRGVPGSPEHGALRRTQAAVAARPAHHQLARVVVTRLADLDPDTGVRDVDTICRALDDGTPIPESIRAVVRRATAGRIDELVEAGVVPSAEVLAELVPQLAAGTSAAAFRDPALRTLMAATYRAFRNRRSLLLLDLEHQVRMTELPWVRALLPHRDAGDDTRAEARATVRRLGELALDGFPGTLLPNPLVRELAGLSQEAGLDLPWVEELAADIFMGRFSAKFPRAAQVAGELLTGSLYARYFDVDYPAVPSDAAGFGALMRARAATKRSGPWGNGMVIEQAQIVTTHNLATLVRGAGAEPSAGWHALAGRAFAVVLRRAGRVEGLRSVKDIAYAWRQVIFYLSVPGAGDPRPVVDGFHANLADAPEPVRRRLTPVVTGLGYVAAGGRFTDDRTPAGGRRLRGWTNERPWLLDKDQ